MRKPPEWLAPAVSVVALAISGVSAYYTYRTDQRTEEATYPVVDWAIERKGVRTFGIAITVRNAGRESLWLKALQFEEPRRLEFQFTGDLTQDVRGRQDIKPMGMGNLINMDEAVLSTETKTIFIRAVIPDDAPAPGQINMKINLTIDRGSDSKSPLNFAVRRTL